ncbi:MAG: lysine/arginine/ornithine ABC transporter substrate-binding protein [Paracoccaceae bacterium]|nr:lysine/arginine/ornithine ABC transporter substrate-binding protein [Paracoccaceae bacterium]
MKRPEFKKFALAAAFAAFATSAAADELNICVEGAYPPFSEINASGDVVGFDIDITNALCAEMGNSCKLVQSEWDGIIPALLEGKCDAIIASMSITEERKQRIDFSGKYYNSPGRFVAKQGHGLTDSPEGLAGKVIGLQRGTIFQDYMDGEMADVELKLYGTQDEVYLDLVAGRIDAAFADSIAISDGFLKTDQGKDFEFFGRDYSEEKYFGVGAGIGVRKGEEDLRDAFTAAIKTIRENGTYKSINDKYFEVDIYGG